MDYFYYTYHNNHIEFSSHIYKVSSYHYNWHGETEILVLLKGRLEMSCNSEVFHMDPMDAIIISPQVGHATLALEQDTTAIVVHVGKDFFQHFDSQFNTYQFVIRSDASNRDNPFFTNLRTHIGQMMLLQLAGESPKQRMLMEQHYMALAADVYDEIDAVKSVVKSSKTVDMTAATFDKMIGYIDEHYQHKIELEDIAKIGGYNVGYTSQFFKRQLGVSFVEYLLRLRLREATVRLVNSEEAIARIANRCGFPDIKAFNVAFKKHFHTTPSEYRKQARMIGRQTKLYNWKEMISAKDTDMIDILHTMTTASHHISDCQNTPTAEAQLQTVKRELSELLKGLSSH